MSNPEPTVETGRLPHDAEPPACWGSHTLDHGSRLPAGDPCWRYLRRDFPPHAQGKLTKSKTDRNAPKCGICGANHVNPGGGVHVDYIGHAFLRERLNEADWSLEVDRTPSLDPMVVQENDGDLVWLPFRMTVWGVTREEVAACELSKNEWPKVLWSDAITRGAMAHGIGLWLWQKDMPTDREPSTRGRGQASSGGRAQRPQTPAEKGIRELLDECRDMASRLTQDGADAWAAWKGEHGVDGERPAWSKPLVLEAHEWLARALALEAEPRPHVLTDEGADDLDPEWRDREPAPDEEPAGAAD